QGNGPGVPQAPQQEIHRQRGNIAALSPQQRGFAEAVDVVGHLGIKAGAGNGQGTAAVALDNIQRKLGTIPEVFRILKQGSLVPKVLEKVVAGAYGNA